MHICVLPIPGTPTISVSCPTFTPPPSITSIARQNVIIHLSSCRLLSWKAERDKEEEEEEDVVVVVLFGSEGSSEVIGIGIEGSSMDRKIDTATSPVIFSSRHNCSGCIPSKSSVYLQEEGMKKKLKEE